MFVDLDIQGLLLQSIFFAVISIGVSKKLNFTFINAASAFWFGWITLVTGTISYINSGEMDALSSKEIYYISQLHFGVFIGFLLASITVSLLGQPSVKEPLNKLINISKFISEAVTDKILNLLLIIGLIFFIERSTRIGFSLEFFADAREVYLERNFNYFEWLGRHLSVTVNFCIIMIGANDAIEGMRLKKIGKVILYSAPLYLASGTRTFLLFPILGYLTSFLLIRGAFIKKSNIKLGEIKSLTILFTIVLLVFSIIGFIRGGYGEEFSLYRTIVSWPVSTSFALESWVSVAELNNTNGLLIFDWFIRTINDIGLLDYSTEIETMNNITLSFIKNNNSAAFIPKSIIPEIIFDFGNSYFFLVSIIMGFIWQYGSLRLNGRGVVLHTIAVLLTYISFKSIQGGLLNSVFVVTIFWAIFFNVLIKFINAKKKQK